MKYILPIMLLFLMAGIWSINISSANYQIGTFHWGLVGGNANSTNYDSRSTLTHQQASSSNVSSFHYVVNIGWFNVSLTIPSAINETWQINITYPYTGSTLGLMDSNCHFIICYEINGTNASSISTNITIFSGNGSGSFSQLKSLTSNNNSYCFNTTIPANFANTSLLMNGTAQSMGLINYTNNVSVSIYGTTFCTAGINAKKAGGNDWLLPIGLLILIASGIAGVFIIAFEKKDKKD